MSMFAVNMKQCQVQGAHDTTCVYEATSKQAVLPAASTARLFVRGDGRRPAGLRGLRWRRGRRRLPRLPGLRELRVRRHSGPGHASSAWCSFNSNRLSRWRSLRTQATPRSRPLRSLADGRGLGWILLDTPELYSQATDCID
ncbi:Protein of unknown function [Gryllus bimaculatus]|nr:Protein of unknown function [Gryllus bimaculatus]